MPGLVSCTPPCASARGPEDHGNRVLEAVMTVSAGVPIAGFGAWFLLFSGSSPLPTGLGF